MKSVQKILAILCAICFDRYYYLFRGNGRLSVQPDAQVTVHDPATEFRKPQVPHLSLWLARKSAPVFGPASSGAEPWA
jgi:hypothetical protein